MDRESSLCVVGVAKYRNPDLRPYWLQCVESATIPVRVRPILYSRRIATATKGKIVRPCPTHHILPVVVKNRYPGCYTHPYFLHSFR